MPDEKEDDAVAVCGECGTVMTDEAAMNNRFLNEGVPAACKFCGGVVVVTMRSDLKRTIAQINRQRGI